MSVTAAAAFTVATGFVEDVVPNDFCGAPHAPAPAWHGGRDDYGVVVRGALAVRASAMAYSTRFVSLPAPSNRKSRLD